MRNPEFFSQFVNHQISNWRCADRFDAKFKRVLDSDHRKQVDKRGGSRKGENHKEARVEHVADDRASDGARPKVFSAGLFTDLDERPGVRKLADEERNQRGDYNARHVSEDLRIGVCRFCRIIRIGQVNAHGRRKDHENVAEKAQNDHALGSLESPDFREDVA